LPAKNCDIGLINRVIKFQVTQLMWLQYMNVTPDRRTKRQRDGHCFGNTPQACMHGAVKSMRVVFIGN